jgi:hypothetical protein
MSVSGIGADVREIVEELDADGGGYRTSEAANMLISRYVLEGVCNADGEPKPKVRTLMRIGASIAFKSYKSETAADRKKRHQAAELVGSDQYDFAEIDDDFAFKWLNVYAAWDEGETAERKMLIRMTLDEVLDVIALKRKKAAEATAVADRLQEIVDNHPEWYDHPEMTIADILDIHE